LPIGGFFVRHILAISSIVTGLAFSVPALGASNPINIPALLDQGWSDDTRGLFWSTAQGSQIIPYDWFVYLEQANSTDLFRADARAICEW
jgi:hypothetical protein